MRPQRNAGENAGGQLSVMDRLHSQASMRPQRNAGENCGESAAAACKKSMASMRPQRNAGENVMLALQVVMDRLH